jgi:hypothetical protein
VRAFLPILFVAAPAFAADYELLHQTLSAGGRRSAAGAYVCESSIGGFAGMAQSAAYAIRPGHIGQINAAPRSQPDAIERVPGAPLQVSVAKLLANDPDDDGDLLAISLSPALTASGGHIQIPGANALNSFAYAASDSFGASASAAVAIVEADPDNDALDAPPNLAASSRVGDTLTLDFLGVPGASYRLQYRPAAAWQEYPSAGAPTLVTAGAADGLCRFIIPAAPIVGYFRCIPQ